ncbi:hypothetical protein CRYUN_Cryun07bG0090000 [Craigia yunnanensis]
MALQIHTPSSFTDGLYHRHSIFPKPKFSIKSQKPTVDDEPKKPASPGQGFGSSSSSTASSLPSGKLNISSRKKKSEGKERECR